MDGKAHRFEGMVRCCVQDCDALYILSDELAAVIPTRLLTLLLCHNLISLVVVVAIFADPSRTLLPIVSPATDPPDDTPFAINDHHYSDSDSVQQTIAP